MFTALLVTAITVLLCVGVHSEGLVITGRVLGHISPPPRVRVAASVLGALCAHLAEIVVFAFAIQLLTILEAGSLDPVQPEFRDVLYFSATCYSSLGFGDIIPMGPMRSLIGIEAVTGLVLIAWTASFTYVEMEQFWSQD